MNILGLHLGHDASVAVIKDNRLVSMVEKERLTRKKYDRGFSKEVMQNALKLAGLKYGDIDYVGISICTGDSRKPKVIPEDRTGLKITKNGEDYLNGPRQIVPWDCEDGIWVEWEGINKKAFQVQHHIAHIASSHYLSPFETSIGFSHDGSSIPENQMSLICECDQKIKVAYTPHCNASYFYGKIAQVIFGDWRDSGKLMGLAAYGEPAIFKPSWICSNADKMVTALDMLFNEQNYFANVIKDNQEVRQNLAASAQKWIEGEVGFMADSIKDKYGEVNVVMSGGGSLNVVANRIMHDRFPLFIAPFPKDDGIAVGEALYILHHIMGEPRETYTTKDICFLGNGKPWKDPDYKFLATELASEKVIFWHQERGEAGPRALTHRSIFASPFSMKMKKRVSEEIKNREWFRPLAPIVTAEKCSQYFDIEPCALTEMMLVNAKVLDDRIKAVTHVDGTARVQTVSKEFNPQVHRLLKEFEKITGVPVLINTSLNTKGEAICENDIHTMSTFYDSNADICVINGLIEST